jgi:large subunit ribosomal protein L33
LVRTRSPVQSGLWAPEFRSTAPSGAKGQTMNRTIITLECSVCKERNYTTTKNKRTMTDKLVLPKFCSRCRKHTDHKETK